MIMIIQECNNYKKINILAAKGLLIIYIYHFV